MVSQIVKISGVILEFGFDLKVFCFSFIFILMTYISKIISISFLFTLVMTMFKLNQDNEFLPLFSSGIGVKKILQPIFFLGTLLCLISTFSSCFLDSWGRNLFFDLVNEKAKTHLDSYIQNTLQEKTFNKDFINYVFYTEHISENKKDFKNVTLTNNSSEQKNFFLTASKARLEGAIKKNNLRLVFFNASILSFDPDQDKVNLAKFEQMEINLSRVFQDKLTAEGQIAKQGGKFKNITELREDIQQAPEKTKRDITELNTLKYHFYTKIFDSCHIFSFCFIAFAIGIRSPRRKKNMSLEICVVTLVVSHSLSGIAEWMCDKEIISPFIAGILPSFLLTGVSATFAYLRVQAPLWDNIPEVIYKKLSRA
tara:strand:+ start:467 stop:1570 length:1104 start_codon:yes stop_codon:yes gene_type:complete